MHAVLALLAVSLASAGEVEEHSVTVLSRTYTIDRIHRSMRGPQSLQQVELLPGQPPGLVWITGLEAVVVGPDGESPQPAEFMCHSSLDFDPGAHNMMFCSANPVSTRLFTLSQGQMKIKFPAGFGLPVLSSEKLSLTTQVLNLNEEGRTFEVRHRTTVSIVRDEELRRPMKPLFAVGAYGLVLLQGEDGYFGVEEPEPEQHGASCMAGTNASGHTYKDSFGRIFTGHWVVKPGREINRTLVTEIMNLPYDTTLHYVAVHLHPFAESLELVDLTSGTTVFRSHARGLVDRIGLEHVEDFSSEQGVPLYKDHEYELVSVYNNTTGQEQDSMAVMYLYLLDKTFRKPEIPPQGAGG